MSSTNYHFPKKTIRDIPLHGKRILLRADFNVPINEAGEITSDYRILQTLPTINYLLERGCSVIICAHLGRPEGQKNLKYSLSPVYKRLKELLPNKKIEFSTDSISDVARQACKVVPAGGIVLLENLRFYPGEEANDASFAESLNKVACADYFVQDGFGVVHRAHASTEAITHLLPSVAGLLLEKEVSVLQSAMLNPRHPLVAVIGGAKISDKIGFIERLLSLADHVLIGGAMANTFLKQQGFNIGKSFYEDGQQKEVAKILKMAKKNQIKLPVDVGVAGEISEQVQRTDCNITEVKDNDYILDLGFESMRLFNEHLQSAATVIWNGTLGLAELPQFAQSSAVLAESLAEQYGSLTSIIGGGDTAEFVLEWQAMHPKSRFNHISTGGGASLELMSGLKLPGLEALLD